MKSVYFKELHNEQEYYCPTICSARAAVVYKPRSLPASLLFKGQGTEHTTVKFGGVARSHARAAREKRSQCEGREKKLPRNL